MTLAYIPPLRLPRQEFLLCFQQRQARGGYVAAFFQLFLGRRQAPAARAAGAFFMLRVPITHAAMRLMEASKKSRPCVRGRTGIVADDFAGNRLGFTSSSTTWSLSQRTGRLTMQQQARRVEHGGGRSCRRSPRLGGSDRHPGTAQSGGWWRTPCRTPFEPTVGLSAPMPNSLLPRRRCGAPGPASL